VHTVSEKLGIEPDADRDSATYRKPDFAGIRVMARSLASSPEPGSISDVAASIGHVAGDQP
jgi:hypothetical protein